MKGLFRSGAIACLVALVLAGPATAAELRSVSFSRDAAFARLLLNFDQVPSYEVRDLGEPARAEVLMLSTKLAPGASLPRAAYPLIALSSFQGKDNLSLSLRLPGAYPYEVSEKEGSLVVSFPLRFTDTLVIPVASGVILNVERESTGTAYYESFYTYLPPEVVASRMHLVVAASHGAKTLPLSAMSAMESAVLAINAGYFDGAGTPVSLVVVDGQLAALPVKPARASLIVDRTGNAFVARSRLEVWLAVDGRRVRVDGFNQPPEDGTVVAYSRLFPRSELRPDAIYYRLSPEGVVPMSFQQVSQESFDDYILALHLSPEADPFKHSQSGTLHWRLLRDGSGEIPVRLAVDGAPMLVEGGRINITTELDQVPKNIADSVRARTAVGFDRSGNLIWYVAREDDESAVPGLLLEELARKMLQLGAWTALNLDGGGSSEMTLNGDPLNLPRQKERKLPVCLVVK